MTIRLIHTSDWQIGKVFRFVDDATMGLLQEARLVAITRLGELARRHGAAHVLVAGDVYDMEDLAPRSLNQPLERMRSFPAVQWHLLPGNHDPYRVHGLWDRLRHRGIPVNVHIHFTPEPVVIAEESFVLLPAPLLRRHTLGDPTAYMDEVGLADGHARIGLAHGTVSGFGSDSRSVANYIAPNRPERAGLTYLALGDWHGQKKITDRCWYSGTPETDGFDVIGGGQALLIEIEAPRAPPSVTPLLTGQYSWLTFAAHINSRADIGDLAARLRALPGTLDRILVQLRIEGALSLGDRQYFVQEINEGVGAALRFMRVDDQGLFSRPTQEDLDQIDRGGFVRAAAEALKRQSEEGAADDREIAALALQRLYVEHMKLQAARQ